MRRRLDLAAALVARPPILFLDEPTTGLDPRSRIGLWETIEGRVATGTTVLLTTQYLDEADRLADRISVIDHGRVIAEGSSDELKDQVGGERLEVTLESADDTAAAIAALEPVAAARPERDDGVLHVAVRQRRGTIAAAVRLLNEAGIGIDDIALRRPTLDDVFLELTGHAAETDARGGGGAMSGCATRSPTRWCSPNAASLRIPRAPDLLLSFTVQPIMFVLLFAYVFGGAIATPGYDYIDFLIPGILVQTMSFGGFVTALGLSEDLRKGLIDRFRSLPMSRAAVLAGRTLADIGTNAISITVMLIVGVIVGFGFGTAARPSRRRHPPAAALRLRLLLGLRLHRPHLVLAGGRPVARLHRHLPAHLHLLRLRPGRIDARRAAGPSPKSTRSRSPSTRCAPSSSAPPPATASGARSPGRSASPPSSPPSRSTKYKRAVVR